MKLNHILWNAASTCTYFSVRNIKRERLLLNAAKKGNLDEVKEFLKSTYVDTNLGSFGFNSNHETPLIKAGKKILHVLINMPTIYNFFFFAARLGPSRIDIVQILLDHNANINFQARNGYYPLYVAGTYVWYDLPSRILISDYITHFQLRIRKLLRFLVRHTILAIKMLYNCC